MPVDPCILPRLRVRPPVPLRAQPAAGALAALCVLACPGLSAPAVAATAIARSALVALEAGAAPPGLTLRLQPAGGGSPLAVSALAVTLDGRTMPATLQADGTWTVGWPPGTDATQPHRLAVTVTHDGIRELLEAELPGAAAAPIGGSLLGEHKQIAWWILNIGVVLVAALALSKRRG